MHKESRENFVQLSFIKQRAHQTNESRDRENLGGKETEQRLKIDKKINYHFVFEFIRFQ